MWRRETLHFDGKTTRANAFRKFDTKEPNHERTGGSAIPTGLCLPAQGCAAVAPKRRYGAPRRRKERATLGDCVQRFQPQRGCVSFLRSGRNPVGVREPYGSLCQVSQSKRCSQ